MRANKVGVLRVCMCSALCVEVFERSEWELKSVENCDQEVGVQ